MCGKERFIVKQGDQYALPYRAILHNCLFLLDDVDRVEITIENTLQKYLEITRDESGKIIEQKGDIFYDDNFNTFNFPLNKEETDVLKPAVYKTEIKVQLRDVNHDGKPFIFINEGPELEIVDSLSYTALNQRED